MEIKTIVNNMTCGGCARAITNGLKEIPEVSDVRVDVASGLVEVEVKEGFPAEKIKEKLAELGYPERK